jgi:hypothetical protein
MVDVEFVEILIKVYIIFDFFIIDFNLGPRDHEDGGKYATGIIGRIYESGELINTTIDITANHLGYFEFRLCPISHHRQHRLTQRCLNKYLLTIGSDDLNSNTRYYLPHGNNSYFYVPVQLPHEIITCKHCVLQWKYHAGNTWGKDENGNKCLGCTDQQEEFYNCADIQIIKRTFNELSTMIINENTTIKNNSDKLRCYSFFLFLIINFKQTYSFALSLFTKRMCATETLFCTVIGDIVKFFCSFIKPRFCYFLL